MRVFCARSMAAAVTAVTAPLADTDIVFEPMGMLKARLAAGDTADVLVLAEPVIDGLVAAGTIAAGSRTAIARAAIGVAVRAGAVAPGIATAEAFVAAVVAARAVALSDPSVGGSAGVYLRDLFGRIGLAATVAAKAVYRDSGAAAAAAVARGDADLAITFIPELRQGGGVRVLGPLPPPHAHATAYAAGVSARCTAGDRAHAFMAALTARDAAPVWRDAGFDPADPE